MSPGRAEISDCPLILTIGGWFALLNRGVTDHCNRAAKSFCAAAMKRAATVASTVQKTQFYARPTRHGVIKCYREFVVGRAVCRHFHR